MSIKKITWIFIWIVLAGAAWYGFKEFNRTAPDPRDQEPDFNIPAISLLQVFEKNDTVAIQTYDGKIIEVSGNVKEIEKDEKGFYTLVLGANEELSSVRCSIDSTSNQEAASVTKSSSVIIRGTFTGYNKDEMGLGADVILNRCALISKQE